MISKILSPSTDVTELNDNAQHLPQLNEKFTNLIKDRSFPILSFYEKKPISAYGKGISYFDFSCLFVADFEKPKSYFLCGFLCVQKMSLYKIN